MKKYDLVIVGAGPSGYAAAMRALDFKKKVLLVEKNRVGGAGVTNGALSSKTWWEISRETQKLNQHLKRFNLKTPDVNFQEIKSEVKNAVEERKNLLYQHMDLLQESNFADLLEFKIGSAKLLNNHEVEVTSKEGKEVVETDYIILATGSRPRKLPNIPIDEKIILTSDGIENLDDFPESMVILGAGVIGCEFATIFSGFGKTKVNLIDKGDRILPFEDDDVVDVIERNMESNGVHIHRNSHLTRMDIVNGKVEYELEYTDGSKKIYTVDKALVSVGRVPNYENLWDKGALDVTLTNRGI
ncbi:MAG: NAD(P)/FAD-dependent oxidoreductase, partial [Fulvivirga sp.]|nr:NAD(P)/FAD-dependent oxidoreductase [Fulvivirga sp.]